MVWFVHKSAEVVLQIAILNLVCVELVVSCSLLSSPFCCYSWDDIFWTMFGCHPDIPRLRYDKKAEEWTTRCPEINHCIYGVDQSGKNINEICKWNWIRM